MENGRNISFSFWIIMEHMHKRKRWHFLGGRPKIAHGWKMEPYGTWHFPGSILFWSMSMLVRGIRLHLVLAAKRKTSYYPVGHSDVQICALCVCSNLASDWGFSWRMMEVTCDVRKCQPQWMDSLDRFWVRKKSSMRFRFWSSRHETTTVGAVSFTCEELLDAAV